MKLTYDKLLSSFAFNCNLRRYLQGIVPDQGSYAGPTAGQIGASTAPTAMAYKAISAATTGACTAW
jgi:hypothetical protein